mmetsp:Transcript_26923/g.38413  ORF Transcript_26923/g.38413 Transcript_26923/m.38413 type:complete len:653 (+) Transcript_26923:42-2000(+)
MNDKKAKALRAEQQQNVVRVPPSAPLPKSLPISRQNSKTVLKKTISSDRTGTISKIQPTDSSKATSSSNITTLKQSKTIKESSTMKTSKDSEAIINIFGVSDKQSRPISSSSIISNHSTSESFWDRPVMFPLTENAKIQAFKEDTKPTMNTTLNLTSNQPSEIISKHHASSNDENGPFSTSGATSVFSPVVFLKAFDRFSFTSNNRQKSVLSEIFPDSKPIEPTTAIKASPPPTIQSSQATTQSTITINKELPSPKILFASNPIEETPSKTSTSSFLSINEKILITVLALLSPLLLYFSDYIFELGMQNLQKFVIISTIYYSNTIQVISPYYNIFIAAYSSFSSSGQQSIHHIQFIIHDFFIQILAIDQIILCLLVGTLLSYTIDFNIKQSDSIVLKHMPFLSTFRISSLFAFLRRRFHFLRMKIVQIIQKSQLLWIAFNGMVKNSSKWSDSMVLRVAVYVCMLYGMAASIRLLLRSVVTVTVSTLSTYGPKAAAAVGLAAVGYCSVWAIWVWWTRAARQRVLQQVAAERLAVFVKQLLLTTYLGDPHPVEHIYEAVVDAMKMSATLPIASPSVVNSSSCSGGGIEVGMKMSPSLWRLVEAEVQRDSRVQTVDVYKFGCIRRCWFILAGSGGSTVKQKLTEAEAIGHETSLF